MPPPLLGYNNNVRHRGRIFHIQTEDSGLQNPRIMTHLFADGGRIVKSTRTDYSEHIGRDDQVEVVRGLMKEQHKAMFVALRCGELDTIIGFEVDAPPASLSSRGVRQQAEDLAPRSQPEQPKHDAAGSEPLPAAAAAAHVPLSPKLPQFPQPAAPAKQALSAQSAQGLPAQGLPAQGLPAQADVPRTYAAPRPASIFADAPQVGESLFGEAARGEKSLDEAILSYLSEDEPEKAD